MTAMRIVVAGASGRMGQTLVRMIAQSDDLELAGALERSGSDSLGKDAGTLAGIDPLDIAVTDDPLPVLTRADGIIDFTTPASTVALGALAAQMRIVHVVGTTGLSEADDEHLRAAARHAVVIRSGNMSLGVNLLAALVRRAARILDPDFDIEIVEMHHNRKVDAPSGTALMLGQAAAAGRNIDLASRSERGRDGLTGPRKQGDIGFASLRGGTVVGEHRVLFAGDGEVIELCHRAENRSLYARGALRAVRWARGRKPGLYDMEDVLGLGEA